VSSRLGGYIHGRRKILRLYFFFTPRYQKNTGPGKNLDKNLEIWWWLAVKIVNRCALACSVLKVAPPLNLQITLTFPLYLYKISAWIFLTKEFGDRQNQGNYVTGYGLRVNRLFSNS
jgi:hypothetical protein